MSSKHHADGVKRGGGGFQKSYQKPKEVGINPGLPLLTCGKDGQANPENTRYWITKMKLYCQIEFIRGLDNIFDANGEYPEYLVPDAPKDEKGESVRSSSPEFYIWKEEFNEMTRDRKTLQDHKVKLTALMIGQMSQGSQDLITKGAEGLKAILDKDPLELVKAVISTHMVSSKVDVTQNFWESTEAYNRITQEPHESLPVFRRRLEGLWQGLQESARNAKKEDKLPDEEMQAMHFLSRLNAKYADLNLNIDRGIIERPNTFLKAYEDAANWKFQTSLSSDGGSNHRGVFATWRGGGRDGGGGRSARGRGRGGRDNPRGGGGGRGRGGCHVCGSQDHWRNECPNRKDETEADEIKATVKEAKKSSSDSAQKGDKKKN